MTGHTVEQFNIQLITEPQITRVGSIYTQSFIFHTYNFLPSRFVHEALAQSIYSEAAARKPRPPAQPRAGCPSRGCKQSGSLFLQGREKEGTLLGRRERNQRYQEKIMSS